MASPSSTLWQSKPACKGAFCRPVVPLGISYIEGVKKRGERGEGRGERGEGRGERGEGRGERGGEGRGERGEGRGRMG